MVRGFITASWGTPERKITTTITNPPSSPLGFWSASPPTMIASSSMSKESTSYYMTEYDQASIFLYLDDRDQPSIQEQRQTLNIFPSQPMHVAEPIPTAKSVGVAMAMLPNGGNQQVPSPKRPDQQGGQKITVALPGPTVSLSTNSAKENKISSLIKEPKECALQKEGTSSGNGAASGAEREGRKTLDPKTLRRLAQNREAARKSRLRKKAYIQQLESSRIRLSQLEQQAQTARLQGVLLGTGDQQQLGLPPAPSPAGIFDLEYGRWVDEHSKLMFQLRAALNEEHVPDNQLQVLVNGAVAQHNELLSLKGAIASADIFHLLCGVWASPAERCFLWLGGFRPSEVIKVILKHVEPSSEGQLLGIYNLQQSLQESEDALNHGMETLQQSLSDTIAAPEVPTAGFMGHMSLAMSKIDSMENIVRQADGLRQQTLQKLHHMLTTRQAARCFVAIADYFHRLRALSTLWIARPRQEGPAM